MTAINDFSIKAEPGLARWILTNDVIFTVLCVVAIVLLEGSYEDVLKLLEIAGVAFFSVVAVLGAIQLRWFSRLGSEIDYAGDKIAISRLFRNPLSVHVLDVKKVSTSVGLNEISGFLSIVNPVLSWYTVRIHIEGRRLAVPVRFLISEGYAERENVKLRKLAEIFDFEFRES